MCCAASCAAPCAMPQLLGAADPLMWKLLPALVREMGRAYPELMRAEALISETAEARRNPFPQDAGARPAPARRMRPTDLGEGDQSERRYRLQALRHLWLPARPDAGRAACPRHRRRYRRLHAAMQRQKAEARASWSGSGDAATETIWFDARGKLGATEFLGYDTETAEGVSPAIVARRQGDRHGLRRAKRSSSSLNQTPFYGESGGQMGDTGVIAATDHASSTVTDTQKRGDGLFVHVGASSRTARSRSATRCAQRRSRAPLAPARQPFGDPSAA